MTSPSDGPGEQFLLSRLLGLFRLSHDRVAWRHDIDHDLACAVRMAVLEQAHGISATFYLRPRASHYGETHANLHRAAGAILACGHQLGTHVDLRCARDATVRDRTLTTTCMAQAALLARQPVGRRVSFHKPPENVLWREVPGFQHALALDWLGRYVSDSRRRFRRSPEAALQAGTPVQVNLHPVWWFLPDDDALALRARLTREAELDASSPHAMMAAAG